MKTITFDIEIKNEIKDLSNGWESYDEMGISVLCAWDGENPMRFFDEQSLDECLEYLSTADKLSGFNSINFDLKVLAATYKGPGTVDNLLKKPHLDVLDLIVRAEYGMSIVEAKKKHGPRIFGGGKTLDDIAGATINMKKSGSGAHAPELWKEGRIAEVYDYCARDVFIEHKLTEFAFYNDYVIYQGKELKLDIKA